VRFLAAYIMQGRLQAITAAAGFAFLSLMIPFVGIVSSAAVALVTLRRGATEGFYILICACLAAAVLGIFVLGSYQFPLSYGLMVWTPIWVIAVVLREGRQLFLAIETVTFIAVLVIAGAYLYQPDLAHIWQDALEPLIKPALIEANPDMAVKDIENSLAVFYRYIITGLVALIYVINLLVGLFLGRWWQAMLYNPGGFKKEYLTLRGQPILAIITLVIMCGGLLFSGVMAEMCWNISLLLFVLYAFVGTIVLHCMLAGFTKNSFAIPLLYVVMTLIPYALIPAAITGLIDTWLNLRTKIPNQTSV
jgi:hypothetical protein